MAELPIKLGPLKLKIADQARSDMAHILQWSQDQHGSQAAIKYLQLIKLALQDILIKPDRLGVCLERLSPSSVSIYHLRYSAKRMPKEQRVRHLRHILAFRRTAKQLHLLRILHDSMNIQTHLSSHLA
jgi:toxin ParE1/3/4